MKRVISNILAILWFFGVLLGTLLFEGICILTVLLGPVAGMLRSGFSASTFGFVGYFLTGTVYAFTGLIPAFRKCYYKLPWLYPLSMIMTMHLFILSITEVILTKGFSVISTPRRTATIVIVIIHLIVCRVIMCIYLRKYPMVLRRMDSAQCQHKASPFNKRIKIEAAVLLVTAIIVIDVSSSAFVPVNTGPDAEEALETHMSATLAIGTVLMRKDEQYLGGNHMITHRSDADSTTMWIWDYADEDGDYVQIIVNGMPLGDPFMIWNKPVSFTVPAVGEIRIVGTRDGGSSITYGVYYELNQITYFGGMNQGGCNLYTLIRE